MCEKSRIQQFESNSKVWFSSNKLHWNGKIASEKNTFWNNVKTIFHPVYIFDVHPKPKLKSKSSKMIPGIINSAKTAIVQKVIKTKPSELYLLKREIESGCKFRQIFKGVLSLDKITILTILKIIPSLLVIDTEGKRLELKVDEFQRKNKPGDASDSQVKHISIENERHKSGKTTRPVNKTNLALIFLPIMHG